RVEGWAMHRKLPEIVVRLDVGGARGSLLMRDLLQRLRRGVEAALRQDPGSRQLWWTWSNLSDLAPGGDAEHLVEDLDPLPRTPWPPIDAADPLGRALAKAERWPELEALAARAYAQGLDPALSPYLSGRNRLVLVQNWGFWRVLALVRMERRDEASGVIKELRAQCGQVWPDFGGRWLPNSLAYYLGEDDPLLLGLRAARDEPPPPDPPKAAPPLPLRLILLGHPAWEKAWIRYASLSAFDAWGPEELDWKPLQPAEEAALRSQMAWGSESRWALMRGPEVLASGSSLPPPAALADQLRAEGIPYLERLTIYLRDHPDRLDAREARLEELRGRMPNERLEALLLQDAHLSLHPFDPGKGRPLQGTGDWIPRKELWGPAAPKAMVELEARLRRWPERQDLWQAWFDWNAVRIAPASPVVLAQNLPIWKTRFDGGAGPLPEGVLTTGIQACMASGRLETLAEWCRYFWEGGVRDHLARKASGRGGEQAMAYTYALALQSLGRIPELRALREDVQTFDPELAASLIASSRPPRPSK
ncbi:MAG TPA: hypothetical protein VFM16_01610, partial [Holophagaceae bacterium]|nr:hypothetical protein [Holophagaceae bacterium]